MTNTDLRLQYKKSTGFYPVEASEFSLVNDLRIYDAQELINYINWLESELVKIKNMNKKLIPWEPIKTKI
jgi:hypothetical protein